MVKKEWSKWDEKRCIEVIKVMNQYPDNLTVGFEECAKKYGEFKPERAERVISTTANFFKGWVSSCTKILQ